MQYMSREFDAADLSDTTVFLAGFGGPAGAKLELRKALLLQGADRQAS
jgi:hypothetical protein